MVLDPYTQHTLPLAAPPLAAKRRIVWDHRGVEAVLHGIVADHEFPLALAEDRREHLAQPRVLAGDALLVHQPIERVLDAVLAMGGDQVVENLVIRLHVTCGGENVCTCSQVERRLSRPRHAVKVQLSRLAMPPAGIEPAHMV